MPSHLVYAIMLRLLRWLLLSMFAVTAGIVMYSTIQQDAAPDIYNIFASLTAGCQVCQLWIVYKYHSLIGIYFVTSMFQVLSTVFGFKMYSYYVTSTNSAVVALTLTTTALYIAVICYQSMSIQSDDGRSLYQPFITPSDDVVLTVQCSICLDDVKQHSQDEEDSSSGVKLQCGHVFHKQCIDGWVDTSINRGLSCPNCRASLNTVQVDD